MEDIDGLYSKKTLDTLRLQRELLKLMSFRHKSWKDLTDDSELQNLFLEVAGSLQKTISLIEKVAAKL